MTATFSGKKPHRFNQFFPRMVEPLHYIKARSPINKLCIIGYYGFFNLGDDLMLSALIHELESIPSIRGMTIHAREDYYDFNSLKIRVIPVGKGIFSKILNRLRRLLSILGADALIWGGGTCLYEPKAGDFGSLRRLARKVTFCRLLLKPFIFIGVGIGNIYSIGAHSSLKRILSRATFFYFRDKESLGIAKKINGNGPFEMAGDLAFLTDYNSKSLSRESKIVQDVAFCGTAYHADDEGLCLTYGIVLAELVQKYGVHIHFIPFHGGIRSDNSFHVRVASHLSKGNFTIHEFSDSTHVVTMFKKMDFVIGFRLHAIELADMLGIANLAVEYSPKIRYYVEKSSVIPEIRLFAMGQRIDPETVISIKKAYEKAQGEVDRFVSQEKMESVRTTLDLKRRLWGE